MIKISWISPASFVDVDLPIIVELQKTYDIYWQIVVFGNINIDLVNYVESQLETSSNLKYEYVEISYRIFDPRTLIKYVKVLTKAKKFNPELYYTSLSMAPFGPLAYKLVLPIKKTTIACHNVTTPKGANRERYSRFYTNWDLRTFQNINVFSKNQYEALNNMFPNKNVLLVPLAIKDYGEPTIIRKVFDENNVSFLFFGIISPYKRIDLLINAAQNIYERGIRGFKIIIAGSCKNWETYSSLIRYPDLFDLRIGRIPNSEVANLFAESDYFVMPYQDIAQSGAITVAYRYNVPIILSDLSQFKPFGEDGKTGFFFETNNLPALEETLIQVLQGGVALNTDLKKGLSEFVKEHYSTSSIALKYKIFFENLIDKTKKNNNR